MFDLHTQIETRLRSTRSEPLVLAQWRLLYPAELLSGDAAERAIATEIAPALRELSMRPTAFSEAAGGFVDRVWEMRNARPDLSGRLAETILTASPKVPETAAVRLAALKVQMFLKTYHGDSPAEAQATGLAALRLADEASLFDNSALTPIYTQLIDVTERLGQQQEAIRIGREAIARIENLAIRDVPSAYSFHHLGRVLRTCDAVTAIPVLHQAWMRLDAENQGKFADEAFSWELEAAIETKNDGLIADTCQAALQYLDARFGDELPARQLCMRAAAHLAMGDSPAALADFHAAQRAGASQDYLRIIEQAMSSIGMRSDESTVEFANQLHSELAGHLTAVGDSNRASSN